MLDPRQIFVSTQPVPRRPVAALSLLAHVAVLAGIVALVRAPQPRVVTQAYEVQRISGSTSLSFSPPWARSKLPSFSRSRPHKAPKPAPYPEVGATEGTASEILQQHAREATTAIVVGIKQRQIYGFDPNNYQIPYHVSGDFPVISAAEVPPRFEQYVTVEITIDVDGSVALAKIVAGSVDPSIQHRLLAAALGFKYSPAKRGGTPIPSQLDLVVHVPS